MGANFKRLQRRIRLWQAKRQLAARHRRYARLRNDALFRASNGEQLPRREREEFDLPDWTGDYWNTVGHKSKCPVWGDEEMIETCTCGPVPNGTGDY